MAINVTDPGPLVLSKFQDSFAKVADSYGTTKEHMEDLSSFITGLAPLELATYNYIHGVAALN